MRKAIINSIVKIAEKTITYRALYCHLKRGKSREFLSAVKYRKSLDLFQFEQISESLPYHPFFYIEDCNYYGILYQLLKFSKIELDDKNLPLHEIYLEHGIVIGSLIREDLVNLAEKTLTYSNYRKSYIIGKCHKDPITIGPYIHYVDDLIDTEEHSKIKNRLGRVMLVFPTHSIGAVGSQYNQNEFCEEIEMRKKNYNTILICMYWKDIQNGDHVHYQKMGYTIVSAGHRDDLCFLNRLKSIIFLSDMVMSNSTGTHIGYSLFLNKPNYLFKQNISLVAKEASGNYLLERHHDPEVAATKRKDNQLLYDTFSIFEEEITENQKAVANHIWGFDCIKTREELRSILLD
jgi:hypothetical protein